jgi:flagellar biosynthesis/type III secretory pathway M-ring protein FliF/YscJ
MPFWKPGSLTEEESWPVTAFLLRQNGLWDASTDLNASNAASIKIPRAAFLTPPATPQEDQIQKRGGAVGWIILAGFLLVIFIVFYIFQKNKMRLQSK